ncbi:MAG: CoA-binding protein [Dehalococcoidia bacterium]|nr:CoA-binding protein [Dehalococcoidia bacterium]
MQRTPDQAIERFRPLFYPNSIAFVGASRDARKWGFIILSHLVRGGFRGRIYPVNPREEEILGLKVFRSISDIPETPDLAVIVVPPSGVPSVIRECTAKGIKAGVVITAGFAEVGREGERLQKEMVAAARAGGMILVGPNGNGIMNPAHGLHPHMAPLFPPSGPVAVVSQSGNVANSTTRRAALQGFGVSKVVSSGNEADLHFDDYLEYLAEDPQTKVILSYVEGFRDGSRFLRVARATSRKKPIVMLKAGETPAGAGAARSHTASLAGSAAVFEAACKQAGIVRAKDMDELFNIGAALITQPLPRGRRVCIVTAGGGWGVLAADACARQGLDVVALPEDTLSQLDSILPAWWTRGNPVDMVAGVRGQVGIEVVEIIARCPEVDGIIVLGLSAVLTTDQLSESAGETSRAQQEASAITIIAETHDHLRDLAHEHGKPIIVASELPFTDPVFEHRLSEALGKRSHVSYALPHQPATVLAALAGYSEFLSAEAV